MKTTQTLSDVEATELLARQLKSDVDKILDETKLETMVSFIDSYDNDNEFGEAGNYTYFDKKGGGQYSFKDKDVCSLFRKLHRVSSIELEWSLQTKKRNKGDRWILRRSDNALRPTIVAYLRQIIKQRTENK